MQIIDSFNGEYQFLSNFFDEPIEFEGIIYPSTEHAYQAAKTLKIVERLWIKNSSTCGIAKRKGSTKGYKGTKITVREDWVKIKIDVMRQLLEKKFSIPYLKEKLLATGDAYLIEGNWWGDTFWGVCNEMGTNWLGVLLMEIREKLKNNYI